MRWQCSGKSGGRCGLTAPWPLWRLNKPDTRDTAGGSVQLRCTHGFPCLCATTGRQVTGEGTRKVQATERSAAERLEAALAGPDAKMKRKSNYFRLMWPVAVADVGDILDVLLSPLLTNSRLSGTETGRVSRAHVQYCVASADLNWTLNESFGCEPRAWLSDTSTSSERLSSTA
jgi:hypothetical protein